MSTLTVVVVTSPVTSTLTVDITFPVSDATDTAGVVSPVFPFLIPALESLS